MKRVLFSGVAILLASAIVAPVSHAVNFDDLRDANREKGQNNLSELQQLKVNFDDLRDANREKGQNNFDELREQHLDAK